MLNSKRLQTEIEELLGHRGSKQNRGVRFKDLGAGTGGALDEKAIQKIAEKKAREVAEEYDGADVDLSEVHQRITHAEQVASGAAIEAGNASSAAANAVTHADQAVDQVRADLAVDYAATMAAATDAIDARDEAVVASTGAGNSAGAALTSSQQAGSFADEAASAAAAANQSRLDAEAARDDTDDFKATAGIARDEAVVARQNAEDAAASAQVSLDMASQVAGRGDSVLSDQFLIASDWGRYSGQGIRTLLPNQLYPIGRTWQFDVTATQTDGIQIIDSPATIWPGQTDAAAFVVEVEYTLLSGSLQGAGVRLSWRNDTNTEFAAQFELANLQAGEGLPGRARVARGVFKRPDNFNGSFASHRLFAFANYASWAMAAKSIQFHRVNLRPATEEELGRGEVMAGVQAHLSQNYFTRTETNQAIAGADLTLNASLGPFRASVEQSATALAALDGTVARFTNIVTVNGEQRAGIEAVSFDGTPGGSGSVLKLIGDDVVAEGTLSAKALVIHDGIGNLIINGDFRHGDLRGWEPVAFQFGVVARDANHPNNAVRAAPTPFVLEVPDDGQQREGRVVASLSVKPGESFSLAADAAGGGATVSFAWGLIVNFLDSEGAFVSGASHSIEVESATWVSEGFDFVVPEGVTTLAVFVRRVAGGSGVGYITNLDLRKKRSAETLILPESITTPLIAAQAIVADHIGAHEIRSSHLFIDERLEISDRNAGFAFGKQSLLDMEPGMFAGVGNSANSFGINISREGTGGVPQQFIMTEDEGLRILNAKHVVTAGSLGRATLIDTNQTIILPIDSTTLSMTIVGGGAGGAGGSQYGTRYPTRAGTDSIVELYDGGALVHTWVASGAAGGYLPADTTTGGGWGGGETQTVRNYIKAGKPSVFAPGGGWRSFGGRGDNEIGAYEYGGDGALGSGAAGVGAAGSVVQVTDFDISDLANPRLVFTRGAGGPRVGTAGGRSYSGGKGGDGAFQYQVKTYGEVPADVVPLIPTAFGTFNKPGNATGANVFPDLGIGLWVLSTNNNDNLDIGTEVEVTTLLHRVRLVATNHAIFFANKRPNIITGWGSARTIQYLFYRMGDWG